MKYWNAVATVLDATVGGYHQIPNTANKGPLSCVGRSKGVFRADWNGSSFGGWSKCVMGVDSMTQVNAGIEFEQRVLDTLKVLNYDVRTEFPSPDDTWIDRIATWLGNPPQRLPRPDMMVRHGEKTVMVEVKAYPILMGPLIQARHYADYYDIERSIVEPSGTGGPASVAMIIGQEVDARMQTASDPARATPPDALTSSVNGRGFELHLRDDLTTAWAGRDPFEVVRELQGETYRIVKNRRTLRFVEDGASYFAKVHDAVGWAEILKELFNLKLPPVGARNEFAACRHLAARRIKAPRVAAFGRRGLNPARARSFVVCDALDGYVSLEDLTDAWATDPPALALRRHLVYAVADLARRLHGAGVNHRDFYLCHIWAHAAALSRGEVELAIIDLHRAQIRPRVPRRWILRDLAALMFSAAHLGLSRNDYLRFLKRYTRRPLRSVLRKDAALLRRVRRRANRLLAESRTREVIGTHRNPTFTVREQA